MGLFLWGWAVYTLFTLSVCLIVAPLSEMSEVLEKFLPVTIYLMIPLSGAFNMNSWLTTDIQNVLLKSPPANCMEMMREGIFGGKVTAIYDPWNPIIVTIAFTTVGLILCKRVRRIMVVE
jgi:capsular polysaccharide transport system permease protein